MGIKKENLKKEKIKKDKTKKRKEKKRHKSVPHKKERSGLFRSGPVNRNHQEQVSPNYEGKTVEEYSHEDKPCPYAEHDTQDKTYKELEEYGNQEKYEEKNGYGGGEEGKGLKVKEGQKLTHKQLQMLETVAEEKQREPTNPLCKDPKQLFRSRQIVMTDNHCGHHGKFCHSKDPVPTEKIYEEQTIEVGIYIDRHLYKLMEEVLKTQDEGKVKEQLLRMVYSLFLQVEAFLMNPSFTSKGGFRISINGVRIYQDHGTLESEWDKQVNATHLLRSFQGFANKVNSKCDGDRDAYDAMVLLTGRYDFGDLMSEGSSIGYAFTGQICTIAPCITLTLRLDQDEPGKHELVMARLLAHEFGHLLGSDHDGDRPMNPYGVYKDSARVPCPHSENLMSPSVDMEMTTWSECTKKMIDAEFERRENKTLNCFFT